MSMLARIKLPPELAVPLAIFGAVVFAALLFVLLIQRLGRTRSLLLAGLVLLYLGATLLLASQRNAHQVTAAADQTARRIAVRLELTRLSTLAPGPMKTPLRAACAGVLSSVQLPQLGLAYPYASSETSHRLVDFRWQGETVLGREHVVEPAGAEALTTSWMAVALRPWNTPALLADTGQFPLGRVDWLVVAHGDMASLFDLRTGASLCEGRLEAALREEDLSPTKHLDALAPVCALVSPSLCTALARPAG